MAANAEEQARAIQHLTRIAYNAGLIIEISVPVANFQDVVSSFGLAMVPDRKSYGEQLPCAWLDGVKLMPTHGSPLMKG